jgi:hypothetical protein
MSSAALAAWEARLGEVPNCYPELERLRWDVLPEEALARACKTDVTLDGCMHFDPGPVISIAADTPRTDDQLDELLAHELMHLMLDCSGRGPGGDPEHLDYEVWHAQLAATLLELQRQQ